MEKELKLLKAYFDPFISTTMHDWLPCEKHLNIECFQKIDSIIKFSGHKENCLRFIIRGTAVILSPHDKETCQDICVRNEFLSDFESLIEDKPTDRLIVNTEAITLAVIEKEALLNIYAKTLLGDRLGRILYERQTLRTYDREKLQTGPTKCRYKKLIQTRGYLPVPQKYLASYLHMSRSSLQRALISYE